MEGDVGKKKKVWTEAERLKLAEKLDAELDEYINSLEKKSYTEGWPEDRWQEEMEKHPFFLKKTPEPGEELSPLVEGLQQLKYGEDENTPEELANNYKEDGNFNYKYKKYRLAILSYTEGIRTKCKDQDLMAQLYNNRAAAHFMLKNYRSSLNDSKYALKLKPNYSKALNRAATCCFHIKDYDQCISLCDQFLQQCPTNRPIINLRAQAVLAKEQGARDKRKQERLEKQLDKEKEHLLQVLKDKDINFELIGGKTSPDLEDLVPQLPQLADHRVHLDKNGKLIWPVIIFYPGVMHSDFIQNFHEDTLLVEQLQELFADPPPWDLEHKYSLANINVYAEGKNKSCVQKVNMNYSLGKIIQNKRFVIRGGAPTFIIVVRDSETEKHFLSGYPPSTDL